MFELTEEQRQELMEIISELFNLSEKGIIKEVRFSLCETTMYDFRRMIFYKFANGYGEEWELHLENKQDLTKLRMRIEEIKKRRNKI